MSLLALCESSIATCLLLLSFSSCAFYVREKQKKIHSESWLFLFIMGGRIKDKGSELPFPRKVTWFCLCCCLENNVGFGMFMGILGQTVGIANWSLLCHLTVKALAVDLAGEGGRDQNVFFCCLCASCVCV